MSDYMSDYSTSLFARPSFWEGIARAIDLGGTLNEYNYSRSGQEADMRALRADWHAIGSDMRRAVKQVLEERADESSEE